MNGCKKCSGDGGALRATFFCPLISPSSRRKKGGAPKTRLLFLVVLLVLGSVIEVRVRLLPFSVPVLRARLVPLLGAAPVPGVMLCGATRRAGELGAGSREDGVGLGFLVDRLVLLLVSRPCVLVMMRAWC